MMPRKTTDLYPRFCEHIEKRFPLSGKSLLVAFSGGADSSVLLHLLCRYAKDYPLTLHALHVDHMIREESANDAAFCKLVLQACGIPFSIVTKDVPAYAESQKLGLEEAAREIRYACLEEYRSKHSVDLIATAHNATDNAETVLFHLTRGSSLRGASGIPPKRDFIIRPLLPFTKREILAYAEENGIAYCTDKTNFDTAYTRNYIRHTVLPTLDTINPEFENAILRFSSDAREDDDALYAIAKTYADCDDTQTLAKLPLAILRRVLLIKYRKIAHNEISRLHLVTACEAIVLAACGNFRGELSFPASLSLAITQSTVFFKRDGEKSEKITEAISLCENTDILFCNRFRITVTDADQTADKNARFTLTVPRECLKDLTVRSRREGDRYRRGDMTRNVKKMLCDAKVPLALRDALPLILYQEAIVYVPFLAPSDLVTKWASANSCYRISIYDVKNSD